MHYIRTLIGDTWNYMCGTNMDDMTLYPCVPYDALAYPFNTQEEAEKAIFPLQCKFYRHKLEILSEKVFIPN